MTDSEIIKALECCPRGIGMKCEKCPMFRTNDCMSKLHVNTLDLINRQKTENENLKVENQSLRSAANSLKMHYEEAQAEIERLNKVYQANQQLINALNKSYFLAKTEAYKECIEKIKEEIKQALESNYKARAERIEKHNVGETDEFISYCQGKIDCLRGLDDFLDNLLKELMGENND